MLAVEALWLFTQSSDGFIKPQLPAAAAAAGPCADTVLPPPPAAAVISGDQRAELWSSLLVRLIFIMEAHKSAAAATADTAAGSGIQQAAAAVRSDLITPASNVLLSTLAECLMSMTDLWQQQPAAARAALIRSVISGSDQSVITRQKKISQLLGKAKPKGLEVVISRLLLLVTHLAAVLVELLQLERTLCGGPRRDGTVPITAAGKQGRGREAQIVTQLQSMFVFRDLGCVLSFVICPAELCVQVTFILYLLSILSCVLM